MAQTDGARRGRKVPGKGGYSLRAHLLVFGVAILVPVLLFAGVLFGQLQGAERHRIEALASSIAGNVAADVDREMTRYALGLGMLAASPALERGDTASFAEQAATFSRLAQGPVTLLGPDGAPLPPGAALPGEGAVAVDGTPRVGALAGSGVDARFRVALGLRRAGGDAGAIAIDVPATALGAMLERESVPAGWSVEIDDQEGRLVGRSDGDGETPGERVPDSEARQGSIPGALWPGQDLSGRPVLSAAETSRLAPWTVRSVVPARLVRNAMHRSLRVLLWSGGVLLLSSLLLALVTGRRLSRPIRQVMAAARGLADGRAPPPIASTVREANELGRILDATAATLRERTGALERAHAELENIYQATPVGIALFSADGRRWRSNSAMQALALPGEDATAWPALAALVRSVAETGRPAPGRELVAGEGEGTRTFRASAFPVGCPDEPERSVGVTLEDVTEKRRAEIALVESQARIQRLLDADFFGVAILTDGRIREANPAFLAMLGLTREAVEVAHPPVSAITPPDFAPLDERALAEVAESGLCRAFEKDLLRADGRRVPALVGYARLGLAPLSVICFALDLTEQRQRETQRRYLMRELTHRTKNLLAVVQAMALQTAKSSGGADDFHERFAARLQGLAGSHDLLVRENWSGASIRDLVQSQLGHYADAIGSQVRVDGPALLLEPEAAQNLGMALHELSTNAAKYGALSVPEGHVDIGWGIRPDADGSGPRLVVEWRESGGPPVEPPRRKGFGHVVMARIAARALDGRVEMNFAPEGLWWRLDAPASVAHRLDPAA